MATTRIIPMHLNKRKTLAQCLADRTEYGMNPDKTEGGALISAFACEPETAVSEFALSKREYRELTGRVQESDVIAYQVRQSFKPGEVTPEEANRIGYEFAKRFLKGRHAFLVCTHTDKKHIHNHIYWNSTALDCTRKFKNFIGSYRAVRRLSDLICAEHRLSVVENPQKHGLSYNKWRGGHDKLSNRDLLRMAIDTALEKQPKDFDALLAFLKSSGYSVARKGRLSLRHENQKQSIRLDSLGEGYSEQELRAVLAGSRTHKPFVRKKYPKRRERATLIADIEAKLNAGKGYRYDQAMKVVKLKQMAKTLIYLEEMGFADFDALVNAAADAEKRFYDLKAAIKAAEARMSEIQTLRTHIMNYSRTRSVYTGYRKAGYSKKYLAEHEGDILIHKAAKKAFDAFGLKKLPTVRSLNEEFARLLAEKKAAYAEYHRAQEQMRELLIHKANAAYLLGLNEQNRQTTERQREEKIAMAHRAATDEICVAGGMGNTPSSKRRGLVRVSAWCLLAPKDLACHVCREPHITRGERCSLFTCGSQNKQGKRIVTRALSQSLCKTRPQSVHFSYAPYTKSLYKKIARPPYCGFAGFARF